MKYHARIAAVASSVFCLSFAHAQTETRPLWEIGAGLAAIDFPVYRGASEHRLYLLPVPYVVYRGETLQVKRDRVRGLIFQGDSAELDVSVNGTVPVKSRDSNARQGMPDLDPSLELGPSLNVHLHHSEDRKTSFDMRNPLRYVVATDFSHFRHTGWLFQPQFNLDMRDMNYSRWNIGLAGGLIFADRQYHQYFYNVAPRFATATRPSYNAAGGYSGAQLILSCNKRQDDIWMGGFMKWDNLRGAVFADSPLVKSKQHFTIGLAFAWIFHKSDKTVEVKDDWSIP